MIGTSVIKELISVYSSNMRKYGLEKTPNLDNFHVVYDIGIWCSVNIYYINDQIKPRFLSRVHNEVYISNDLSYYYYDLLHLFILFLDPQNAADDFVFLQEADRTELNKLVAIKADIENIPCGLVLTREPYESNAIELLNESIFLTSSC